MNPMEILILEPYYGGSHKVFVDTVARHSRHNIQILTMPARKWKWRMRGSAFWFAGQLKNSQPKADAILTCDMVNISDLKALLPDHMKNIPIITFFHENQLTYPLSENDWRDYQFGFTNIVSAVVSDAVWFNSASHRNAFLEAAGGLIRKMPDFTPLSAVDEIRNTSEVCWLPVEPPPEELKTPCLENEKRPLKILWPHRWEYDKAPEDFFKILFSVAEKGMEYELIVLGENFRKAPGVFGDAWEKLESRILHRGYATDKTEYWKRLLEADVVISTAIQENFGIAIVEAMLAGCYPLLPNRLSYPEILPEAFHEACLYQDLADLEQKLSTILTEGQIRAQKHGIQQMVSRLHALEDRMQDLDERLEEVTSRK